MLRMRVWRALLAQMCSKLEFGGLFAWGIPNPLFYRAKGFKGLWFCRTGGACAQNASLKGLFGADVLGTRVWRWSL